MKKSQLTAFVIVGLVLIVLMLILYSYSRPKIDVEVEEANILGFAQTKAQIESYTESCLGEGVEKALKKYGARGSEKAISRVVDAQFMHCIDDFERFRGGIYEISYGVPDLNVTITERDIKLNLGFRINLSDETQRTTFENFFYEYRIPDDFKDPLEGFDWIYGGIVMKYEVISDPRPNRVWFVKVDLDNPDVSFLVTPKISPDAMTTSEFLRKYGVSLAINGGQYDRGPPHEVWGYSMHKGKVYSAPDIKPDVTLFISKDNKLSMQKKIDNLEYAITGQNRIVEDHQVFKRLNPDHPQHKDSYENLQPSTAFGIDEEYNWFLILIVDGRQGGSQGLKLIEMADIFLENNAGIAINMDGGGSTAIVANKNGYPVLLNKPSDGEERAVANHLGIYALPLEESPKLPAAEPFTVPTGGDLQDDNTRPYNAGNPAPDDPSIVNFHYVSDGIARGGQPSRAGYEWLLSQGYATVIDLQGYDNTAKIPLGMTYYRFPMHGDMSIETLRAKTQSVLSLISSKKPVYVHCQWGSHRTGMVFAIYRMTQEGWSYDAAYAEMMPYADNYFPYPNLIETIQSYS